MPRKTKIQRQRVHEWLLRAGNRVAEWGLIVNGHETAYGGGENVPQLGYRDGCASQETHQKVLRMGEFYDL